MPKAKVDPATRDSQEQTPRATKRSAGKPGSAAPGRAESRRLAAARLHAEAMRQAECAAMLIAVTRLLLDMRGRDYAAWLRSVADDFEATDPDQEHPDDVSDDLIGVMERDRSRSEGAAKPEQTPDEDHEGEPGEHSRPH